MMCKLSHTYLLGENGIVLIQKCSTDVCHTGSHRIDSFGSGEIYLITPVCFSE